jgi:hypothetical protein
MDGTKRSNIKIGAAVLVAKSKISVLEGLQKE